MSLSSPFQEARGDINRPMYVFHNWPTVSDRASAISAAFDYCAGMDTNLRSMDKRDAMHARLLEIESDDGHILKFGLIKDPLLNPKLLRMKLHPEIGTHMSTDR